MKNVANTIEDLLEILAGLQGQAKIQIDSSDATIMYSIARQSFKGTALTDRQYALMKEKLQTYRNQFTALDYDFDRAIDSLRQPLRHIDRAKYIKVVDYPEDMVYESNDKGKFIKIRFPFKKSDIMLINKINNTTGYYHLKGSHEHYFYLNETNAYNVIHNFKDKQFEIDSTLLDYYNKIVDIKNRKKDVVCGIYDNQLLNFNHKIKNIALKEIGDFNKDSKILYIDRKLRYGIDHVDEEHSNTLIEKIAFRKDAYYNSKPSLEHISEILMVLWELKRFPLLVILERSHAEDQLHSMINFYRDILPFESQSVLFRQDGTSEFNQLVKDRKLNNWVDENTKIVYISSDKLPKLLLRGEWNPYTTFSFTSSLDRSVDTYIKNKNDLIIFREEELSPLRRYSRYYGRM